jgi:hypothetical protein
MKSRFVVLALGSVLIATSAATAQIGDGAEPCIAGHQFEPGPIVNGHHRQPTQGEIDSRTRELRARSQAGSGSCAAAPHSDEALMQKGRSGAEPARS